MEMNKVSREDGIRKYMEVLAMEKRKVTSIQRKQGVLWMNGEHYSALIPMF